MSEFKREIKFSPAYDKTNPDPEKNYGIHGTELAFYLSGEKGTIQFKVMLNWMLPQNREQRCEITHYPFKYWMKPMPSDLGYHSYLPLYEGQRKLTDECPLLDNKPCYYDGSTLNAEPVFEILISEGEDGVWKYLESYYDDTFKDNPKE